MAKIKGTAIRGALKFVKESDSPHQIPDVLEALPFSVAPVYEQRILAADWYPYEAYAELLRVMDEEIGRGDLSLMPELGRFGAERDIRGVLKIIATFSSVEKLIARGDWFWNRYCDSGDSVVLESDSGRAVMALKDFPASRSSTATSSPAGSRASPPPSAERRSGSSRPAASIEAIPGVSGTPAGAEGPGVLPDRGGGSAALTEPGVPAGIGGDEARLESSLGCRRQGVWMK